MRPTCGVSVGDGQKGTRTAEPVEESVMVLPSVVACSGRPRPSPTGAGALAVRVGGGPYDLPVATHEATTMVVRGVPVAVEIHGTGTPLLLIHGWGVDRRLMTGCMEPLFDDDAPWLRIYPDLPGMGGTPGDPAIDGSDAVLGLLLD